MIHKSIEIWEKGIYSDNGEDGFKPLLDTYILNGSRRRGAILICPGGGYGSTSPREAEPIAVKFNEAGFHTFVLYYRVKPRKHLYPLMDLSRAMCIIRENADAWNIDPDKIAVCGFSAGGHLAASLGVHWDKPYLYNVQGITRGMNKPNALILCYPVISSGKFAQAGSFKNLLGSESDQSLLDEMSLECQVSEKTPPTFIWHTFDDNVVPVENSLLFATALRKNGIPFELHIYTQGPHGLSLATEETDTGTMGTYPHVATWVKLCTEWLIDKGTAKYL